LEFNKLYLLLESVTQYPDLFANCFPTFPLEHLQTSIKRAISPIEESY
jgi:hypothetical protein